MPGRPRHRGEVLRQAHPGLPDEQEDRRGGRPGGITGFQTGSGQMCLVFYTIYSMYCAIISFTQLDSQCLFFPEEGRGPAG